jgi:hypothetical protein
MLRRRNQLVTAVSEIVCDGKKPSPMLKALAELDFPVVFTTNYDPLFEQALVLAEKTPRVAIYTPRLEETTVYRNPDAKKPIVVKLHGDIARGETIVITDEDYVHFVLRMGDKDPYDPIPLKLKYFLSEWTTLFVGYSLLDYNLRLLFKTLSWRIDPENAPDTYSVDYRPDPLILDVWDTQHRYVKFIAQNVWSFVPELYTRVLGRNSRRSRHRSECGRRPDGAVSRDPPVPLRRSPDLLRARGGDRRAAEPSLGLPRRDAVWRLGRGEIVAGQRGSAPRGAGARA